MLHSSQIVKLSSGSKSVEHYTPDVVIKTVLSCFDNHIDLDPCSNLGVPNIPAKHHYTSKDDGLKQAWWGNVFVNPPYGRVMSKWVDKCLYEYECGRVVQLILLTKAATGNDWFQRLSDYPVAFWRGRLAFKGNSHGSFFDSSLFYMGVNPRKFVEVMDNYGTVYSKI